MSLLFSTGSESEVGPNGLAAGRVVVRGKDEVLVRDVTPTVGVCLVHVEDGAVCLRAGFAATPVGPWNVFNTHEQRTCLTKFDFSSASLTRRGES